VLRLEDHRVAAVRRRSSDQLPRTRRLALVLGGGGPPRCLLHAVDTDVFMVGQPHPVALGTRACRSAADGLFLFFFVDGPMPRRSGFAQGGLLGVIGMRHRRQRDQPTSACGIVFKLVTGARQISHWAMAGATPIIRQARGRKKSDTGIHSPILPRVSPPKGICFDLAFGADATMPIAAP